MPKLRNFYKFFQHSSRGFTLIEVIIAIALLGMLAVAFLGGLSTGLKVLSRTDELETARNIAEKQMEYVMKLPYQNSPYTYPQFPDMSTSYPGYTVTATGNSITGADSKIQKILVMVSHNGNPQPVITLEDYKVQR